MRRATARWAGSSLSTCPQTLSCSDGTLLFLPHSFSVLCRSCSLMLLATRNTDSGPSFYLFLPDVCLYSDWLSSSDSWLSQSHGQQGPPPARESSWQHTGLWVFCGPQRYSSRLCAPYLGRRFTWARFQEAKFCPKSETGTAFRK